MITTLNDKYFETRIKQVTRNIFLTTEGYKIYSEHSKFAVNGDIVLVKYNANNNKYYVHKIIEKTNELKHGVVFYNKKKNTYCIKPFSEYTTYYIDNDVKYETGTVVEFIYSHYNKTKKCFIADVISEYDKNIDHTNFKIAQYQKPFSEKVLNENKNLQYTVDKNRVDLSTDIFITLDGNRHNAYSFESTSYGYRMKISIPDISIIKASTYTNNDAYQKGFSVVLDKIYGILPDYINDYILNSNNVLCLIINMNHSYETINYCFVKAYINIKKHFGVGEHINEMNDKKSEFYAFLNNMCVAGNCNKEYLSYKWNDTANRLAGEFMTQYNKPFIGFDIYSNVFSTSSNYATITDPLSSYISIMNNRIIYNIIIDKQIGIGDIENDCIIMNALYSKTKDVESWYENTMKINTLKSIPKLKGVVIKNTNDNYSEILINNNITGYIFQNIKVGKYVDVCLDKENSQNKLVFKII